MDRFICSRLWSQVWECFTASLFPLQTLIMFHKFIQRLTCSRLWITTLHCLNNDVNTQSTKGRLKLNLSLWRVAARDDSRVPWRQSVWHTDRATEMSSVSDFAFFDCTQQHINQLMNINEAFNTHAYSWEVEAVLNRSGDLAVLQDSDGPFSVHAEH